MGNKRHNRTDTEKIIQDITRQVSFVVPARNNEQLAEPDYLTNEQRIRDKKITQLLNAYVVDYQEKTSKNRLYKDVVFWFSVATLGIFTVIFAFFIVIQVVWRQNSMATEDVVSLVSVCITYLTLVVGILKIITKHIFPAKEEKNITEIVKTIQDNDFQNKKENLKAHFQEEKLGGKKK